MNFPIDANAYFKRTRSDPALHAAALRLYASLVAAQFVRPPKTAISRSDAGRCGAQVAAEIAGLYDIPDDGWEARDQGTLRGLYKACCIKVAIEFEDDSLWCVLEGEDAWNGVGGHTDLSVYEAAGVGGDTECVWVAEFKHPEQYDVLPPHEPRLSKAKATMGKELQPPRWDYVAQGGHSALSDGAPIFSVAIWGLAGSFSQGNYEVLDGLVYPLGADDNTPALLNVADEYARIAKGERDPRAAWMCQSCRFGACPNNLNERRPETDLSAALQASIVAASAP